MLERMKKRLALCDSLADLKNEASFALMFLSLTDVQVFALLYQSKYDELFDRTRFNDALNE